MVIDAIIICFILFLLKELEGVKVRVQQGPVIGAQEMTIFERRIYFAFYGIPYAKPPLGKFRYKNPEPPKKWKILDASTVYHGACAQAHIVHRDRVYGFEDCLHLNIYTPFLPNNKESLLKPVVVWVHGYGFTSSFSHIHGGDFFIDNDVLFVSVSYRLGAFGFLNNNEDSESSNMGLKDIVMALKWIRKNIKHFGGDKKQITVMGSGSGATFLALIMTTKYKNLFSKIIMQSGSLYSPSILQSDSRLEKEKLIKNLKLLGEADVINAKTSHIISASQNIYSSKEIMNFQKPVVPFTPSIEIRSNNSLLTTETKNIFMEIEDFKTNKPIMIGFNSQESISEVFPFIHNPHLLRHFEANFRYMVPFAAGRKFNYTSDIYKKVADTIKHKYFHGKITENSVDNFLLYSSHLHKYPVYRFIKNILNTKHNNFFTYKFHYNGKFNAVKATSLAGSKRKIKGASNGDEICYILKCEPLWETYAKISKETNNRDRKFIKQISELWSNFAKTGNPTPNNYKGNVTWLPGTTIDDNMLLISSNLKLITKSKVDQSLLEFWNQIYKDYYRDKHCNNEKHTEL